MVRPAFCSAANTTVPVTMNPALSTLTAAITRARRSAPAHAWMAENTGTMNRPPAMASPARSMARRRPRNEPKIAAAPRGSVTGATQ